MPYIAFSDFQLAIMLCLPHLWVTFPEGEKKKVSFREGTVDGSEILHQLGCVKPCK